MSARINGRRVIDRVDRDETRDERLTLSLTVRARTEGFGYTWHHERKGWRSQDAQELHQIAKIVSVNFSMFRPSGDIPTKELSTTVDIILARVSHPTKNARLPVKPTEVS